MDWPVRPIRVKMGDREVVTHGLKRRAWRDIYHYCMTVGWLQLLASWAAVFTAFNLLFAAFYALAPGSVANVNPPGYLGAFFFSIETLATVGYGDMHPATAYGHLVAGAEIFLGMTLVALVTGVIFARFSRPTAKVLFADVGVVRPMDGRTVLMFRTANARQNIVMEAQAQLRLIHDVETAEGERFRRVEDLPLVRNAHPLFVLGWNLMHVIDEASPLNGETPETLAGRRASFALTLSGTDETTGQILMARHSYAAADIRWGHIYRDIVSVSDDDADHLDYRRFHETEPLRATMVSDSEAGAPPPHA